MSLIKRLHTLPTTAPYLSLRLTNIILLGLMAGSVLLSSYFVYDHVYRTLDDANTIVVLNSGLGIDTLNTDLFEKAKTAVNSKRTALIIPASIRNVFMYSTSTVPTMLPPTSPESTTTIAH